MTNFHVGQKVVCINGDGAPTLVERKVYTVTAVWGITLPTGLGREDTGVAVAEAEPVSSLLGFAASRFRPVTTRKTSIEIFQRMLNPSRVKEKA